MQIQRQTRRQQIHIKLIEQKALTQDVQYAVVLALKRQRLRWRKLCEYTGWVPSKVLSMLCSQNYMTRGTKTISLFIYFSADFTNFCNQG